MKVNPFNKHLLKDYLSLLSVVSIPFGFLSIFIDAEDVTNWISVTIFIVAIIGMYILTLCKSNSIDKLKIKIRNNDVIIYYGDILEENEGVKVITTDEYFDTEATQRLSSNNTLTAKYIKKFYEDNIEELDKEIEEQLKKIEYIEDIERVKGKKKKYEPGTAVEVHDDTIFISFAKCDEHNREYLPKIEYFTFLMKMWNSVDILYRQRDIYVPLIGTGVCRIDSSLKPQDYLEQLLNSLYLSGLDLAYDCEVYIVLSEKMKRYIDLYKIKNKYVKSSF